MDVDMEGEGFKNMNCDCGDFKVIVYLKFIQKDLIELIRICFNFV